MTPYRTAAVDEAALADAAEITALARSSRGAKLRAQCAVVVVVVATVAIVLVAFLRLMSGAPRGTLARAAPTLRHEPTGLRTCAASGACFEYVSCLDTTVKAPAECDYWAPVDAISRR